MIPLLIGGAAAAIAAVAAVSAASSSGSSSTASVDAEKRRLERQRVREEAAAKKASWRKYAKRVSDNLAKKYGISDRSILYTVLIAEDSAFSGPWARLFDVKVSAPSSNAMSSALGVGPIGKNPKSLFRSGARFKKAQEEIGRISNALVAYESGETLLEEINAQFK